MKKLIKRLLLLTALTFFSLPASAAQMTLTIEDLGNQYCLFAGTGSCYYAEIGFDVAYNITGVDGIKIGETQPSGLATTSFLSFPAEIYTTSPVNILSTSGNTMELDFSGWGYTFTDALNQQFFVPLGGDASIGDTGIATVSCSLDCSNGDTYVLNYSAG